MQIASAIVTWIPLEWSNSRRKLPFVF